MTLLSEKLVYAKVKLVDPVLLEMHTQCWAIIYPQK